MRTAFKVGWSIVNEGVGRADIVESEVGKESFENSDSECVLFHVEVDVNVVATLESFQRILEGDWVRTSVHHYWLNNYDWNKALH